MAVNMIIVKGVTANYEVKKQGEEGEYVKFSILTKEYAGKNEAGESEFAETWFDVTAFGGLAKKMQAFKLDKGGFVEVIGSMRSNTVEQPDGSKRTYWGILARDFEMLRAKGEGNQSAQSQDPSDIDLDADMPF